MNEADTPILENEAVKELLAVLRENQAPGGKELLEAIGHVAEMEKQLVGAVEELKAMRQELQGMKENPLKRALQNSVKALEANVAALRERLFELKGAVIEGCKKTLAAFKEHGISALAGAARFFHLKPAITALRGSMEAGIRTDEKALAKIQAVSAEYHEVGRHLKNLGRALMGKEAVQEAKEAGRLAKAVAAPYRAERACLLAARNSLDRAAASLEKLERAAEKKPSILEAVQKPPEQRQPQGKKKEAPAHDGR